MQPKHRLALACALVASLGAAAFAYSRTHDRNQPNCSSGCTECGCFAPDVCGGGEVVFPAGPECFMPEVCLDRTVVCPPCDGEQTTQ